MLNTEMFILHGFGMALSVAGFIPIIFSNVCSSQNHQTNQYLDLFMPITALLSSLTEATNHRL